MQIVPNNFIYIHTLLYVYKAEYGAYKMYRAFLELDIRTIAIFGVKN